MLALASLEAYPVAPFPARINRIWYHIDPDVDAMRDQLMADLAAAGGSSGQFQLPGIGPTVAGRNAGGDRYFTDGMIDVGVLEAAKAAAP